MMRPGRWLATLLIVAMLTLAGAGVHQAVSTPGYTTWQDTTSTMLRAVGLGPALDRFENWLYTRSAPSDVAPDPNSVLSNAATPNDANSWDTSLLPALTATADNAGWHPVTRSPGSAPLVYTAVIQPDPLHRSVVVGVGLIRTSSTRAHLMPGTVQPVRSGASGQIPADQLPDVVAAFNSGFKMSNYSGGFYLDGRALRPLVDGKASVIVDDMGRLTVGQWGRDAQLNSHIRAVRQNLSLIIDQGRVVPGLDRNTDMRWGSARNQLQYTWRSGLGITATGDVVYVAGDKLNLATLAEALRQSGAVEAMELDIHSGLQFFSTWSTDGTSDVAPQRLMEAMVGPADRYVHPDQRDFFYFTTVPAKSVP